MKQSAHNSKESYLQWLTKDTSTTWWHDSGNLEELEVSLSHGAGGVTTNPPLIAAALRNRAGAWSNEINDAFTSAVSNEDRAYALTELVVRSIADRLTQAGRGGGDSCVCAQVNPGRAGNRDAMFKAVERFHAIGPAVSVKVPAAAAGLDVAEACLARGISMTVTVSFTVAQVLEIGEMYVRACAAARASGVTPGKCTAVIMIGRIDDYIRDVAADIKADVTEEDIRQAGIAVVKRAYKICRERDYKVTLCVAALRGPYHVTRLAGGDFIISVHPGQQPPLLDPALPKAERIDQPVSPDVIRRLCTMPEFQKAYEPHGLNPNEFIGYGAAQRTLSQFVESGWKQIEAFKP